MWISLPREADVDRLVDHAFAPQPLIEAKFVHQVDRALLQHAGAHAILHIGAAARLEHDAIDALAIEKMREKQARRTRADDGDLCVHRVPGQMKPPQLDCGGPAFQALKPRSPGSGKRFAEMFMRGRAPAALPSGGLFCNIGLMALGIAR